MNGNKKMGGLPKRILSLVLTFAMVFAFMPGEAYALGDPDYITISPNDGNWGTVSETYYDYDSVITVSTDENKLIIENGGGPHTITATPNSGYAFVRWEDASGNEFSGNSFYGESNGDETVIKAVFAPAEEEYPIFIYSGESYQQVKESNKDDVLGDGGTVSFDPETNTLTLSGATICTGAENTAGDAIYCNLPADKTLTINLIGSNVIGKAPSAEWENFNIASGISSKEGAKLILKGDEDSSLTIYAGESGIKGFDISLGEVGDNFEGKLKIYSLKTGIQAGEESTESLDPAEGGLTIYGGDIDIKSKKDGLFAGKNAAAYGSKIKIDAGRNGIYSEKNIQLSDVTLSVTTNNDSEGVCYAVHPEFGLNITGSAFRIVARSQPKYGIPNGAIMCTSLTTPDGTKVFGSTEWDAPEENITSEAAYTTDGYTFKIGDDFASAVILHICSVKQKSGQAATCTEDGWKDYYQCTNTSCSKIYASSSATGTSYADLAEWKASAEGKIESSGHNWIYTASGAALTATCSRDGSHIATLTLTASDANYSGNTLTYGDATDSPAKDIGITGYNAWVSAVGTPIVEFSSDNGATWSSTAPTNFGNYKMRVYPAVESENPTNIATKDFSVGVLSWNSLQSALNNQSEIKLSGDITAVEGDHPITITREVTIDLNGHTLDAHNVSEYIAPFTYRHAFLIKTADAKLILKDSSAGKTGKLINDDDAIRVKENGSLVMEGGTISAEGVGVAVESNGTFVMKGGTIKECNIGVSVDGGYFNMKDGASIINNSDSGVDFCSQAENHEIGFLMEGGIISDNGSQGIMFNSGDSTSVFTMTGGKITGHDYSNVFIDNAVFNISGAAEISGSSYGIRISGEEACLNMTGGKITGNEENGICSQGGDLSINISGGEISGNDNYGVNLEYGGNITLIGGKIINNGNGVIAGNSCLGGTAVIKDNTEYNLVSYLTTLSTDVPPAQGMQVGVTLWDADETDEFIESGATEAIASFFFADEAGKAVYHDSGKLRILPHQHDWKYSATNNKLEAYCANTGCDNYATNYDAAKSGDKLVTLTLTASSAVYSGSTVTPSLTFGTPDENSSWTGAGLTVPTGDNVTMKYFAAGTDGNKTGSELSEISAAGNYIVETTVVADAIAAGSSAVTVSVPFKVLPTLESFWNNIEGKGFYDAENDIVLFYKDNIFYCGGQGADGGIGLPERDYFNCLEVSSVEGYDYHVKGGSILADYHVKADASGNVSKIKFDVYGTTGVASLLPSENNLSEDRFISMIPDGMTGIYPFNEKNLSLRIVDGKLAAYYDDGSKLWSVENVKGIIKLPGNKIWGVGYKDDTNLEQFFAEYNSQGKVTKLELFVTEFTAPQQNEPGGSGRNSGDNSPNPTTVPVTGEKETVKVEATVSGSTATVKDITEADLKKVSGGENIEIDLSGLSKNIDSAKIPAATVEKIAEQSGMTVKLSTATVTFDRDASASITEQAQGETIELVVDDIKKDSLNTMQKEAVKDIKMEIVIDAYLVSGGARICSSDKGGFGKGEATVILPYDIKDSASKYSVYYIDDKGKLENLNARYDENLKSFVFKISHFSNYAIAYDESAVSSFVDVPAGEYYYDAVKWAAANGITAGTDATHFGPSLGTTRAQVVTFLWRMAGSPEPAGNANKFADVKAGSYYEKAVAWAIEEGITKGTGPAAFSPDSTCTRGQIVTFLYRFAGIDTSDVKDNPFIDVADGQFYHDAALWAAENGITTGVSKNLFSPDSSCIRAQIVTFLYRYMGK